MLRIDRYEVDVLSAGERGDSDCRSSRYDECRIDLAILKRIDAVAEALVCRLDVILGKAICRKDIKGSVVYA